MEARLPQVDKLLRHPLIEAELENWRREIFVDICRRTLDWLRGQNDVPDIDQIAVLVKRRASDLKSSGLKRLINGTGVVLNTNLGRAPLVPNSVEALQHIACRYTNLEMDLVSGKRGMRSDKTKLLLKYLTGCEAALVVNNNAAAVVLTVNCFAKNREVIVSRGELIEIGGSFRLPDVIESAGARLKEVGTTNRTRIADFQRAISPDTGLLMRCHRSNFKISGFTEEVSLQELVQLSNQSGIPFLEDLGSGVLVDLKNIGLNEPTVSEVIKSGCGLVSFSGDKLLGGPQAGIIAGRKDLIDKLAKHPLYRALRVDKVTNVLLEQTLLHYLSPDPFQTIPALKMMSASAESIRLRVAAFLEKCQVLKSLSCRIMETRSAIGGGSLPGEEKPSWSLVVEAPVTAAKLAVRLREFSTPVIAVVQNDELRIDFRTVFPEDENLLIESLFELDQSLACK